MVHFDIEINVENSLKKLLTGYEASDKIIKSLLEATTWKSSVYKDLQEIEP